MYYLQNHCWCSKSNWDDGMYSTRHLLSIGGYGLEEDTDCLKSILAEDADSEIWMDTEGHNIFIKRLVNLGYDVQDMSPEKHPVPTIKPSVIQWLNNNVADRTTQWKGESSKGWCIGNTEYRMKSEAGITIFFHRKKDLMSFVKEFSKWGKPTKYLNYFKDEYKELDLNTLKYKIIK